MFCQLSISKLEQTLRNKWRRRADEKQRFKDGPQGALSLLMVFWFLSYFFFSSSSSSSASSSSSCRRPAWLWRAILMVIVMILMMFVTISTAVIFQCWCFSIWQFLTHYEGPVKSRVKSKQKWIWPGATLLVKCSFTSENLYDLDQCGRMKKKKKNK